MKWREFILLKEISEICQTLLKSHVSNLISFEEVKAQNVQFTPNDDKRALRFLEELMDEIYVSKQVWNAQMRKELARILALQNIRIANHTRTQTQAQPAQNPSKTLTNPPPTKT